MIKKLNLLIIAGCLISNLTYSLTFATKEWQTPNGVHVIFYPAKEVPILDVSMAFAAGSAYDGEVYGLSSLTSELLDQGNNGLDASAIADKLERTGAQFSAASSRDMVVLNLRTLTNPESLKEAISAYSMIIGQPDFPKSSFDREKQQLLMSIKQTQESPDEVANQAFYKALYQNHPYGHPVEGDATHVEAITPEQVKNFYHQYFVGKNATLVMVGAIEEPIARELATQLTAKLPSGEKAHAIPQATPLKSTQHVDIPFPSSQTVLRLGQLGITHHDPRYFPLVVGNYILGGGALVSELAIELREKRGLTYGVYSQYSPMTGVGPFLISLSTQNNQASTAANLTREVLTTFVKNGPTEKQLQEAKQYLTGGFPLSLASNKNIADILLKIAFYDLPKDYLNTYLDKVNAVTLNEVTKAFKSQISPDALLQVSVGKK